MKTQLLLLFHIIFLLVTSATTQDNIAINCGSHGGATVAEGGRRWVPDDDPSLQTPGPKSLRNSASAATQDYAPQIPYMTARISRSPFSYQIPVSAAGPILLRLHFHPASYSADLDASAAFFSVSVNSRFLLLRNFSASLTARALAQSFFFKEFSLSLLQKSLNITFTPSTNSIAFINGIEVLSMPRGLYLNRRETLIVGLGSSAHVDETTAMETVYRLNVNGQAISPAGDSGGLFRQWSDDSPFLYGSAVGEDPYNMKLDIRYRKVPNYTAPAILYRTARSMGLNKTVNNNYNLTWTFPVDSGFLHLVRLHFCEIAPEIKQINQRVFQIFLNNRTADAQMDIMVYAGAAGVPIYREFVVIAPAGDGKQNLWLALHPAPESETEYSDALLNGLEIFKLNRSNGDLAGSNPDPGPNSETDPPTAPPNLSKKKVRWPLVVSIAVLGGGAVVSALFYYIYWRKTALDGLRSGGTSRWWCGFSGSGSDLTKTQDLPWSLCRHFTLEEITSATDNFSDALVIGAGGFGKVYKGVVDGEGDDAKQVTVAIKRLNPTSQQGAHEFRTEIEMLSQLRHRHLVSLIGYCEDRREMILVYDYMGNGALRDHIYGSSSLGPATRRLPWKQRLEICIGAARGLHYLHTGAKHSIIHRDVKTTNILLDDDWVAKVSDFGLSRVGPTNQSHTHVSTEVKGSFGYLDPEYYRRQQLTDKSDVFSFGVVLFEVLCGRAPLDRDLTRDEMCLSEWARAHHKSGQLDRIVDPYLKDQIAPECLKAYGEIADRCLLDHGVDRPPMGDVVGCLEFAMQLQEGVALESLLSQEWVRSLLSRGSSKKSPDHMESVQSTVNTGSSFSTIRCGGGDGRGGGSTINSALGMSDSVFSELMSPRGR